MLYVCNCIQVYVVTKITTLINNDLSRCYALLLLEEEGSTNMNELANA